MNIETAETPDTSDDLRGALDAAISQVESQTPEAPEPSPGPVEATPESTPASAEKGSPRDEKGRFAPKVATPSPERAPGAKEAPPVPPASAAPKAPEPPSSVIGTPPPTPPEVLKPPASWKALAREEWGKLPEVLQREVIRREKETSMALEQSSEARQHHHRFREIVAPYEPIIRAQGVDPYVAVQNLLQTTAALATAPIPTRAGIIANLIKTYLPGRESLEVLDTTLAGVMQGQPVSGVPQAPPRDPRVDDLLAQMNQVKQAREQSLAAEAAEAVKEIEGEEFYEDVREEMADLMEVAAKRGVALSVRECYDRAVLLHPEVSKVIQQRKAAQAASNPVGSTARSRAAASSVRPSPAAPPNGAQSDDLRSIIENAWDKSMTR